MRDKAAYDGEWTVELELRVTKWATKVQMLVKGRMCLGFLFCGKCFRRIQFLKGMSKTNKGKWIIICGGHKPPKRTTKSPLLSVFRESIKIILNLVYLWGLIIPTK